MGLLNLLIPSSKGRLPSRDPFWNGKKKQFAIVIASTFVLLQLLFLGNLSYVFGSIYRESTRIHNIDVLVVDYDSGVIGQSLRAAIAALSAPSFPSLREASVEDYQNNSRLIEAVRRGNYWAAIYTHAGASDRLAAALQGGDAARTYNASNAITYVWNEARYPTVAGSVIKANLETLIAATRIAYNSINGTRAVQYLATDDSAAVGAFLNPLVSSDVNIKPTMQAARSVYNTIPLIMAIIMQFFFLMVVNGVSASLQLYSHLPFVDNGLIRLVLSATYTLAGSLCMSSYIWAFKENWTQSTAQFFLMWMILWLYQHINFSVMDVATAFIPMSFLPFFVLTWSIVNVTSTIFPFELNPGFYRWGYALPAHETWQVLIQIWSGGAGDRLYQALPILFAWWIVLFPTAAIAVHYRCLNAAKAAREADAKVGQEDEPIATVKENLPSPRLAAEARRESVRVDNDQAPPSAGDEYFPRVPVPFERTLDKIL